MKKILRKIYDLIPFKTELFFVFKKVFNPGPSIYRHLHFKGIITVPVDSSHAFKMNHYGFQIENEIFWAGLANGWEKISIRLWIELCKRSEVIVDAGANTGIYSLIAKSLDPKTIVYAFEPVKRVYEKLQENNKLNNFNINCYEVALSNNTGKAVIYDLPSEHVYSVTVNQNRHSADHSTIKTEIQTITLDLFIENNNLKKIDLLKLDVETHEPEVMEGFKKYLKEFSPVILIEILNDEVGAKVQEIVSGIDYLYFNIDERSGIRRVDTITKSDYYNYLLCNPATAKDLKLTN